MSLRAEFRRAQRHQNRRCLSVADIERLNKERRLPADMPKTAEPEDSETPKKNAKSSKKLKSSKSSKKLKKSKKLKSSKKLKKSKKASSENESMQPGVKFEEFGYDETRWVSRFLHNSVEARKLVRRLCEHPGLVSGLHPIVLLTAVLLQADDGRDYMRSDICKRINGFDTRFWHEHGMCTNKTRTPVSYNMVCRQLMRIEEILKCDGKELRASVFDRLSTDLLRLSVPPDQLEGATALAVDQTAFPTHYRTTNFEKQEDIDRLVKQARQSGGKLPKGVILGEDDKLVRCADDDARAGHRSASTASGGKAGCFVGYFLSTAVLIRPTKWSGRPQCSPLVDGTKVKAYVLGLNVTPASANPGEACMRATLNAVENAPKVDDVVADRGITNCVSTFNRLLHALGVNVTMDYKRLPRSTKNSATRMRLATVGSQTKQQVLIASDGMYAPWTPKRFRRFPGGLNEAQIRAWFEGRAKYRWVEHSRPGNGRIQFICPQHAGKVKTSANTRGHARQPKKTEPTLNIDADYEYCCNGSVTLDVGSLDTYQKIPYGTHAFEKSYGRRSQVENNYSGLRRRGGLTRHYCRARGLGAHRLAALALCVVYNFEIAAKDTGTEPLTTSFDDFDDGDGCYRDFVDCGCPEEADEDSDGVAVTAGSDDSDGCQPLRAPP